MFAHFAMFVLVAIAIPAVLASSDFWDTCRLCDGVERSLWLEDTRLQVKCLSNAGVNITSEFDLNNCFKNDHGILKEADPDGNYWPSCYSCHINWDVTRVDMICMCSTDGVTYQSTRHSTIDLNAYIGNNDGLITCLYGKFTSVPHECDDPNQP